MFGMLCSFHEECRVISGDEVATFVLSVQMVVQGIILVIMIDKVGTKEREYL